MVDEALVINTLVTERHCSMWFQRQTKDLKQQEEDYINVAKSCFPNFIVVFEYYNEQLHATIPGLYGYISVIRSKGFCMYV